MTHRHLPLPERPGLFESALMLLRAFLSSTPVKRYEARHRLVAGLAHLLGFRVYNKNLYWVSDEEFLAAWSAFPEATQRIPDRKFVLFQFAKLTASLPGDTVECGAFDGGSSHLICSARQRQAMAAGYEHHVFDSFEGLSEPEARDRPAAQHISPWRKHDLRSPEERLQKNLAPFPFVRVYKGWIPHRFEEVSDRCFALVHVDVDLYQPTYDSLTFFYPRLVPGGVLICDDYGFETCPGAHEACHDFVQAQSATLLHLPTGQGVIFRALDAVSNASRPNLPGK